MAESIKLANEMAHYKAGPPRCRVGAKGSEVQGIRQSGNSVACLRLVQSLRKVIENVNGREHEDKWQMLMNMSSRHSLLVGGGG